MNPATVIDEGVERIKQVAKSARRGLEELEDFRDEAAHRVRRRPLAAVGLALSVGVACGVMAGWVAGRRTHHRVCNG